MLISKEEFKKKIDTLELSDDSKISLLEDIEDSWNNEVSETYKAQYEEEKANMLANIASLEAETASLKARYKERFFTSSSTETEVEAESEDSLEGNIIDVKEI